MFLWIERFHFSRRLMGELWAGCSLIWVGYRLRSSRQPAQREDKPGPQFVFFLFHFHLIEESEIKLRNGMKRWNWKMNVNWVGEAEREGKSAMNGIILIMEWMNDCRNLSLSGSNQFARPKQPKAARQAEMESNQTHFIVCVWWMEWKGWVGSSLGVKGCCGSQCSAKRETSPTKQPFLQSSSISFNSWILFFCWIKINLIY